MALLVIAALAPGLMAVTNAAPRAEATSPLREQARNALRRGVEFFRKEVAVEGTYLWQYSEDLSKREGEGKASATRGWVQPPGTPAVGMAYLTAFDATADTNYLDAARDTAYGLGRGQLQSGGWTYSIDFNADDRKRSAYRDGGTNAGRNVTTFDDDTTQSALRFLMRTDRALGFKDAKIHECVRYALESLLQAQYPNGAWPQGYDRFPDKAQFPVKKAGFPETWSRTWPGSQQYWLRYTLNDGVVANLVETLFEAQRIYSVAAAGTTMNHAAAQCRSAAEKSGDFILLAQLPEPQPAWAQQYDFEMHPAWARKFEPPSVTGGESQGILKTLFQLYRETGHRKYLEPVPRALDYLRRSRLPDGRLARFYEVRTNRPLYFTKNYDLTHDDSDLPTHYAFKVTDGTEAISREYERLKLLKPSELRTSEKKTPRGADSSLVKQVQAIIAAQDLRGRWVEDGRLRHHGPDDPTRRVIRAATFVRNLETLSRFLSTTDP